MNRPIPKSIDVIRIFSRLRPHSGEPLLHKALVALPVGDHAAHAAARPAHITRSPGDQMDASVKDRLTCTFTIVEAQIEAVN